MRRIEIATSEDSSGAAEVTASGAGQSAQQSDVVAIIPARAGSKGIFGKNIVELGGVPLIAHSIMAARNCANISRVIVSTDSQDIAGVSREWGADVPFVRPRDLAGDHSPLPAVIAHTLETLKDDGCKPQSFVVLYPTHPFRTAKLMDELTWQLLRGNEVYTVRKFLVSPFSHRFGDENGGGWLHDRNKPTTCYRRYGLFVGQIHSGQTQGLYVHELTRPHEFIDIDTPEDLERARLMLESQQFVPEWK